jgi:nucleoside-diphosphate-sugar epimerase
MNSLMNEAISNIDEQCVALVTGGTGFVGRHLVCHLVRNGWQVQLITRPSSRMPDAPEFSQVVCHVHDGSIDGMVNCVALAKPHVVFHLASLVLSQYETKDVESLIASNLLFGNQLLEAMKVAGVTRFINTGTFWQHYDNEGYNPVCLYAATKQAFEALLEYYVQACSINAITLKLFDTYGADDPRLKLFRLLENAAFAGEPLDMSGGEQYIDLVHVEDVVEAFRIAAQRLLDGKVSKHETYAISSGQPMQLKELVQRFTELTNLVVAINWGARPYRSREVRVPWNKGKNLPGWVPKIHPAEGIKRTCYKGSK